MIYYISGFFFIFLLFIFYFPLITFGHGRRTPVRYGICRTEPEAAKSLWLSRKASYTFKG